MEIFPEIKTNYTAPGINLNTRLYKQLTLTGGLSFAYSPLSDPVTSSAVMMGLSPDGDILGLTYSPIYMHLYVSIFLQSEFCLQSNFIENGGANLLRHLCS